MLCSRIDTIDRNLGLTRVGFGQANTMEGEKYKGIQGICKRVIIMMESRLGRERNEFMRTLTEKKW